MPRQPKTSNPAPPANGRPLGNYPPDPHPKGRHIKYTSDQQNRLNHLVFGLGCCRWTIHAHRLIRDVWLKIPEERGGGEGIGLSLNHILWYCKTYGVDIPNKDERFGDFFRWLMNQPEYESSPPPPAPYKNKNQEPPVRVDTPTPTPSLDNESNVPVLPMEKTQMGTFQDQAEMIDFPLPPMGFFHFQSPAGSFPGPLSPAEARSPSPVAPEDAAQATVEQVFSGQSPASFWEESTKFFQIIDEILPDRPRDMITRPHTLPPPAIMYPPNQSLSPVFASYAATVPTSVTTVPLAAPFTAVPSLMSPRSRVGHASRALGLSPHTAPPFTPTKAAVRGHTSSVFRLKVRYSANCIDYLAAIPGLVSIEVRREDLLENIIEYEIIVMRKDVMSFLMKSPGFVGVAKLGCEC